MIKLLWTVALLTATSSAVQLDRNHYSDDMFLGMACSTTRGQGLACSSRKRNRCRDQQLRTRDILSTRAAAPTPERKREYWVELKTARRRPVRVYESIMADDGADGEDESVSEVNNNE